MIRHAAAAVPFTVLAVAAALIAVLLRVVQQWPYTMWPLEGIAVGVLAATALWCFDERAASVVDTLPRPLVWRTAARGLGVIALVTCWLGTVAWTAPGYFGHAPDVAWQGCAATLGATAYSVWRRGKGVAAPARSAAAAIVGVSSYLALARPLDDDLPIFPYTGHDAWSTSAWLWSALAAVGVIALAVNLSEWRPRSAR